MTGDFMTDGPSFDMPFAVDGVHVEISGIRDEDAFLKDIARKEVINAVKKIGRTAELSRLVTHVKKSEQEGRKARFDVHMRATANGAEFHADGFEWDLPKAMSNALDNLEAEVEKYVEKHKYHTDHSGSAKKSR
jgi:ribosome-associated translation inhibitor RaiA